ncbi:hypothetical protein Goslar_00142 [Escherichia phage vB_EcoM_Goslar]|jgi:hypothetical protein|uniref:Uncharacterized protein n=1 Tax=Escherichia phage vB_EcoM_Goslar TaxID=2502409 RepID=A0A482GN38_BPGOS|nr:hypothetical protein HOV27_gp142 [Escherichia phage vB_EcoM_Goslar]ECD4964103.1 hypothetical protein [Salmonella enterica subsp. enterica serovar Enteritidis]EEK9724645.1 hypothetical protein [Salmonella enterica]QBO63935.1 hypothetical protein Goslar_00142 [Escherichia phage vB_EcoM_Goslar]
MLTKESKKNIEAWIFDDAPLNLSLDPKVRGLQADYAYNVLHGCCYTLSDPKYRYKFQELLETLRGLK